MRHSYFWYVAIWWYGKYYCAEAVRLTANDNLVDYPDKEQPHDDVRCLALHPMPSKKAAEQVAYARNTAYMRKHVYMPRYRMGNAALAEEITKEDVE